MSIGDETRIARGWARLGAMLNAEESAKTPDLERLLLDTARVARGNVQMFLMAATWLSRFGIYVAKRRLAVMVGKELEVAYQPVLGLLLELVQARGGRDGHRFREVTRACAKVKGGEPFLWGMPSNAVVQAMLKGRASAVSKRWGLWLEPIAWKDDALRSAEWVARRNPSFRVRALCGGDLAATLAADGAAEVLAFESESALASRYDASRVAIREALHKLTLAGMVERKKVGRGGGGRIFGGVQNQA